MRENRFPWGGRFVLLLAMLTMLMTMPALALFDHDDLARSEERRVGKECRG